MCIPPGEKTERADPEKSSGDYSECCYGGETEGWDLSGRAEAAARRGGGRYLSVYAR